MSCGDLVLACESAEDLSSADLMLGEVDLRWPGASLCGCELAQGAVGSGGVVVPQVLGQHVAQVVLVVPCAWQATRNCDSACQWYGLAEHAP